MTPSDPLIGPSEAAKQLGVSAKALRLYEQRGLISPLRTAAGWRVYGTEEMMRAAEIVALRGLGLSLRQVERVLTGSAADLAPALAMHQTLLEGRIHKLSDTVEKVRCLRADCAAGKPPLAELTRLLQPTTEPRVAFNLPWPWGGECFELRNIPPLTYIIGPLGSGKTRLAKRLAEELPNAFYLGLERTTDRGCAMRDKLDADPALKSRVDRTVAWLVDDGAAPTNALVALLTGLECNGPAIVIVDMLEQGLDRATQEALINYLRRRGPDAQPIFALTRSSSILDLAAVGDDEAIILCPANHSPPIYVAPYPGTPGYEAVATCLAPPDVRARTEGVVAWRPNAG